MILKKKNPKFQRTQSPQYSKLGRKRKKKQKYRHARGLDNKMRLKHKGKPVRVMIGFRSDKRIRSLIDGKKIVSVSNIQELKNVKKNEIALISKIGRKKKNFKSKSNLKEYLNSVKVSTKSDDKKEKKIERKSKNKKKTKETKAKKENGGKGKPKK